MDEVPASSAVPGPRRPSLSVVVPVRNGGRDFEHCLRRLRGSRLADFELIVVDDGSTDGSGEVARAAGAIVVRNPSPRGPAAARNLGARVASAPLVFFVDADVAVSPEALGRAVARLDADPGLDALFGSYDDAPAAAGLVSQYRNLLHHFVHQDGTFTNDVRPVRTFWTGCGIIRRAVFLEFGGFDPGLYPRPAIEDIELGYRLTRAGRRIVLARDVLATHMKRWGLVEMVRTDVFQRGVPWMLLIKRSGTVETDLNVKTGQKVSVALTGLTLLALGAAPLFPPAALGALLGALGVVGLNARFFTFLARRRGPAFALAALPLQLLYYSCCGASVAIATVHQALQRRRAKAPAALEATAHAEHKALPAPHLADERSTPTPKSQARRTRNARSSAPPK